MQIYRGCVFYAHINAKTAAIEQLFKRPYANFKKCLFHNPHMHICLFNGNLYCLHWIYLFNLLRDGVFHEMTSLIFFTINNGITVNFKSNSDQVRAFIVEYGDDVSCNLILAIICI